MAVSLDQVVTMVANISCLALMFTRTDQPLPPSQKIASVGSESGDFESTSALNIFLHKQRTDLIPHVYTFTTRFSGLQPDVELSM